MRRESQPSEPSTPARGGAPRALRDRSTAALLLGLLLVPTLVWLVLHARTPAVGGDPAPPSEVAAPAPVGSPAAGHARMPTALSPPAHDAVDLVSRLLEGPLAPTDLEETIDRALDATAPVQSRLRAVHHLTEIGDPLAREALERVLDEESHPSILAEAAAALTAQGDAAFRDALLADVDDAIVVGALRGLGAAGETDALAGVMSDPDRSEWVRAEAARALGHAADPSASDHLLDAYGAIADDEFQAVVLEGLGSRPFAETETFFRDTIDDPRVPLEARQNAIEALATAGASGFLLEIAASSRDEALRTSAVQSLAALDGASRDVRQLGELLTTEPSPEVRAAIYAALAFHAREAVSDPGALLAAAHAEPSPHARLHGYRAVASLVHGSSDAGLQARFDAHMVPWLQSESESGATQYARRLSLNTLALAETPGSDRALANLSRSPDEAIASAAREALERHDRIRGEGDSTL